MTTTRVVGYGDNAVVKPHVENVGEVRSSDNYRGPGIDVRDGFFAKTVTAPDQLSGSELVRIDGVEMTAKMAREYGILDKAFQGTKTFDESLSVAAARRGAEQAQATAQPKTTEVDPKTPEGQYRQATHRLEADIDNGTISVEEAKEYDTNLARVAMQSLSVEHVVETIDGLADGTVNPLEVPGEVRSMIRDVEASVTRAASASAKTEIGIDGFQELAAAAKVSPEVNQAIRDYAVMRASGRADGLTWADLLADVRDHLAGRR